MFGTCRRPRDLSLERWLSLALVVLALLCFVLVAGTPVSLQS